MRFSILPTLANSELSIAQVRAAHQAELDAIARYCRLTNYLAAAQIYLKDNFLLKEPLKSEHIKDCLLGHWGTCPGINLIYVHLNCLIQHHDISLFLVAEAGHGTPAMLANLYLERSLQAFYPELTLDANGLATLIRGFSSRCGFLNHDYAGEELGYALAVAFGAVMDNPDLIVACVISDQEAETGATATAWDSYKLIDPAKSGAVLPILHLNGDKTIYAAMSDIELQQRFTGYGYQVRIVGSQKNQFDKDSATQNALDLNVDLYGSLDWAYREICRIQQAARLGQAITQPKFPLLIVRSPKDWTGIQEIDRASIKESHRSHQIPAKDVKTNPQQLQLLEDWLRSYKIEELFDQQGCPIREILNLCPQDKQRMGCHVHISGEGVYKPLNLPNIFDFAIPIQTKSCSHEEDQFSSTEQIGKYIKTVIEQNPQTFRIFCPDQLESSNLSALLEVNHHNDHGSIQSDDLQVSLRKERMLEFFSQHTCQGWLQGYLLTGRHGLFLSHEASLNSIISMMNQHARFLKLSKTLPWRSRSVGFAQSSVASLNYLAVSTPWQQEYSDFSQQSSSFINAVLTQKAEIVRVYLPPDANCLITTIAHCLNTTDQINLILTSADPMPQWLTMAEAIAHCRAGASIWHWASTDQGINPDVVLVGIGDRSTVEVMAAAHILREEIPALRVRVVNVTDLRVLEEDAENSQHLDKEMFEALFTRDRPVIINFHGTLAVLEQLFFGRPNSDRFQLNGDQGEVISSFAQNLRHGTSRFHLIIQAIRLVAPHNPSVAARATERVNYYKHILAERYRSSQKLGSDRAPPKWS
ncbi:phosphoketolase family protein [Nostoc sp.]|uniref:phosphoketolase family protein n=1 Tax=Nostoc sp. TaxID=1180 RepID=UPI002FF9CE6E